MADPLVVLVDDALGPRLVLRDPGREQFGNAGADPIPVLADPVCQGALLLGRGGPVGPGGGEAPDQRRAVLDDFGLVEAGFANALSGCTASLPPLVRGLGA
ncbi:hypothetical protein GCM10011581_07140 [Saccharopolyspora subtropica]|uniref:Uncharacterized protein n=1 Tax=Saccharopolyspora thermophila TaxID=89367 RepID=A0A917JJL2_9PSEU|nr:hypothetical protein GCM10011581_07140 [Saccharopolyspora subtropica]